MPLKEFECRVCHKRFETVVWLKEPDPSSCPHCGAKDLKQILGTFRIGGASRKSARDEGGRPETGVDGMPDMTGFDGGMSGDFEEQGLDGYGAGEDAGSEDSIDDAGTGGEDEDK